jgi:hypothetical protein
VWLGVIIVSTISATTIIIAFTITATTKTISQESASVLLKLNVPVHLSGAVAMDSANVIRISRSSLDRMDARASCFPPFPPPADSCDLLVSPAFNALHLQARGRFSGSTRTCWPGA